MTNFYLSVCRSSAHRPSRDYHANLVIENPELLDELIEVALNTKDTNHYKACWILELVLEKNIRWLAPHLDLFCETLPLFSNDGAIRSISKITWFSASEHLKSNTFLSEIQIKIIIESCFDWLIGNTKVASKTYAMRTLFEMGKLQQWIYPDLKSILELGYADHSPAYKAASKQLLKKIK